MKTLLQLLLFGAAAVLSGIDAAEDVQLAVNTRAYIKRALVVDKGQFTAKNIERIAREFIRNVGTVPVGVLYVTPNPNTWKYYLGQGSTGVTFDEWNRRLRLAIAERWEPLGDIAEVNVMAGQAVIRLRESGKLKRLVLTPQDPLDIGINGVHFEILEIQGVVNAPDIRSAGASANINCEECLQSLQVFMRTKPQIDISAAMESSKRLATLIRPADLNVHIRTDPWFVGHLWFPMLYAFADHPPLPSFEEYRNAEWAAMEVDGRTHETRVYGSRAGTKNR